MPPSSDAIKILTGYAMHLNCERKLWELEVFQQLSLVTPSKIWGWLLCLLLTHFVHPGIEDDGEHLCLVTELFLSNIQDTQDAIHPGFFPLPIMKHILRHLLLGIVRLHTCGIAHTGMFALLRDWRWFTLHENSLEDIKPDNIMIGLGSRWATQAIDIWVTENPPCTYTPERSLHKMVSAFVSQLFPPPMLDVLPSSKIKLGDFNSGMSKDVSEYLFYPQLLLCSAQFVSDQTTDNITPFSL